MKRFYLIAITMLALGMTIGCDETTVAKPSATLTETPATVKLGPVQVEHVWTFESGSNTGQYQFKKQSGEVVVVLFCAPEPIFEKGQNLYDITYQPGAGKDCDVFISAQK